MALGVRLGLGFIAEDVVCIREDSVKLLLKEFRNEGGGEGE